MPIELYRISICPRWKIIVVSFPGCKPGVQQALFAKYSRDSTLFKASGPILQIGAEPLGSFAI